VATHASIDADRDALIRSAYEWIRRHGDMSMKGRAYFVWARRSGEHGVRPTTFFVNSIGEAYPNSQHALLADLRLLMLERGLPVAFLATFDRKLA
jgi:hypothetical protein